MAGDNIYQRVMVVIQRRLAATGIPQHKAISASAGAVEYLHGEYGGQDVHLPKTHPWRGVHARNTAIRSEWNGRNMDEMCTKYSLSRATIYRITGK